jgi:hypothetical protein
MTTIASLDAATGTSLAANAAVVRCKFLAAAALVGLALFCSQPAGAQPMKCSGEKQACIAACNQLPKGASISVCLTNCSARQAICVRTGCWDNGMHVYCGLSTH